MLPVFELNRVVADRKTISLHNDFKHMHKISVCDNGAVFILINEHIRELLRT